MEFAWQPAQERAFARLKDLCSHSPVLKYYDPSEPVEIFCDAGSSGVRAVLLQDNHPVAFTFRSLTDADPRSAQIEKEMLFIVHACTKCHHYIFGKSVTVYNDHKPLEDIFKKSPLYTHMGIQRIHLHIQWYDLTVKYRKGKDMELSYTLSRAQLTHNIPELERLEGVSILNYVAVSKEKYAELQVHRKKKKRLK